MAISKRFDTIIFLDMLQTKDLFDMLNLIIFLDLFMAIFPYIQQLTSKREHTIVVLTNNN